ncbi:11569_t:CDS:1, partial [Ambispora gerdemannii]
TIEEENINPIFDQPPQIEWTEIKEKFNDIYSTLNEISQQLNEYWKQQPVIQNTGYY